MRQALYRTIGFAVLGSAALSASSAWSQSAGNPVAGESLALSVCTNCHLVQEGQRQPPMDSVPSFAAVANNPAMSETRLRGFLSRPHFPMPSIELSNRQIDDLVAYIQSRRGR